MRPLGLAVAGETHGVDPNGRPMRGKWMSVPNGTHKVVAETLRQTLLGDTQN